MFNCFRRCSHLLRRISSESVCWNVGQVVLQSSSSSLRMNRTVTSSLKKSLLSESAGSTSSVPSERVLYLNPDLDQGAPYILTKEQENYVVQGDLAAKLKLDTLLMELFVMRQKGYDLPGEIDLDDLLSLLNSSRMRRLKYLIRIKLQNLVKAKDKEEREEKRKQLEIIRQERNDVIASLEHPWLQYRLFGNALFPRIYSRSMNHFYNTRLEQGRKFGQNIVFDCSYNETMREMDIKNAAKQIIISLQLTRESRRPFSLTICNIEKDDRMFYYLKKSHPMIDVEVPLIFSESNYTDLFPREDIVYLSPHSRYDLEYNPNDVYIIGALVDKVNNAAHSIANARENRVRSARLPIDRYVNWQQGSKSLCINQVVGIMLSRKNCGSWQTAFEDNLPKRKLNQYEISFRKMYNKKRARLSSLYFGP